MKNRPLHVGIIGGGGDAFIVNPQQRAVFFDGTRRVTAGALRSNPKASIKAAENWPFPIHGYPSYDEMLKGELKKPEGEKIDYVLIVTPNHVHYDPAKKFLEHNIPVFCEKPLTITLDESEDLVNIVNKKKIPFCVAHTYIGHWSSRLARHIVQSGLIGNVRWVDSSYIQGWLSEKSEDCGLQQAQWRVAPDKAGISNCGGDIGTHALMQLRYVTGLEIKRLSAFVETFVKGRKLDDHFTVYCELNNGGKALVRASQIAIGHKNDMSIEVNGDKGTLIWRQEEPEKVVIHLPGQPDRVYWRGAIESNDGFLQDLPDDLMAEPTIPSGHGEAFHDAFARLHRCFEKDVRDYITGTYKGSDGSKYALVDDGMMGIKFVSKAVTSSEQDHVWIDM
jgi:predicted dehydrogenase